MRYVTNATRRRVASTKRKTPEQEGERAEGRRRYIRAKRHGAREMIGSGDVRKEEHANWNGSLAK